jgi:hypothetical protein
MLNDKEEDGSYKIPFIVVADAFQSEMTAFADLILPDTTYLERHDAMSMLDRPISEFDGPVDSVRIPVVPPHRRVQTVPGSADRTGQPPETAGLHDQGRQAQIPRLPGLHRQLRDRAGFRHRLPGRLARQGRREVDEGRAEPEPVADVRAEQLRLPLPPAEELPVHAQLEPGLSAMGAGAWHDAARRADQHPHLFRGVAEVPPRGAGQDRWPAAAGAPEEAHRDLLRPAAVLLRTARSDAVRQAQIPAQRGDPAADGDVSLLGFAERLAAPDPRHNYLYVNPKTAAAPGIEPTTTGSGSSRNGARCAAWRGCRKPSSPARSGPGTPSARPPAPGTWTQTPTRQAGLPAQSPDLRGTAGHAGCRRAHLQLRPGDRPSRLVRRAGAHLQGRRHDDRGNLAAVHRRAAGAGHAASAPPGRTTLPASSKGGAK